MNYKQFVTHPDELRAGRRKSEHNSGQGFSLRTICPASKESIDFYWGSTGVIWVSQRKSSTCVSCFVSHVTYVWSVISAYKQSYPVAQALQRNCVHPAKGKTVSILSAIFKHLFLLQELKHKRVPVRMETKAVTLTPSWDKLCKTNEIKYLRCVVIIIPPAVLSDVLLP